MLIRACALYGARGTEIVRRVPGRFPRNNLDVKPEPTMTQIRQSSDGVAQQSWLARDR